MSKLDAVRTVLREMADVTWDEDSIRRPRLRRDGMYEAVAINVAPVEPITTSVGLKKFSARLARVLETLDPTNITRCYEYAETYRDVVKMATAYYVEPVEAQEDISERRIAVTMYPCRTMARHLGVRGVVELRTYECPEPCKLVKTCQFDRKRKGFYNNMGVGWFR